MKQVRVAITKKCNRKCSYCLMKNKELMDTLKDISLKEALYIIATNEYKAILITGGEPLYSIETMCNSVSFAKVAKRMQEIIFNKKIPAYIYTNGDALFKDLSEEWILKVEYLSKAFDGVNISLHDKKIDYKSIEEINKYIPVRLHIQDIKSNNGKLKEFCKKNSISLKIWKKDDCVTEEEDRFVLSSLETDKAVARFGTSDNKST